MKKLFKEWRKYLVSTNINETRTGTLPNVPNVRMTSPVVDEPGNRPDPLRWRDHLKRQYPDLYNKLSNELRRRFKKYGPGLEPRTRQYSSATRGALIRNNIIEYWDNAMRGLETGAPLELPKKGFFKSSPPSKPLPSPEDIPTGRPPAPTQSPSGRVTDYPAARIDPATGKAVPPEGFKEPFPKKSAKTSKLKTLGPAGVALATVDGVDSLTGPELRKAIAALTGGSREEISQIPTPTLKQRVKRLISSYTAPFEMGAGFVKSKLFPSEQERRATQFQQKIEDTETAERWAELAGYELTGGDASGVVRGKKKRP